MEIAKELREEFQNIIEAAYRASADVGKEVEYALRKAEEHPLDRDEASRLLTQVVITLKARAELRDDSVTQRSLSGDVGAIVASILQARDKVIHSRNIINGAATNTGKITLVPHNGVPIAHVLPVRSFQGINVPMNSGFIKTADIKLWKENKRLDIHIGQFQKQNGRPPGPEEIMQIMLSQIDLPGVSEKDQFQIVDLARSVAANGVRVPPILDNDGTPLDGNRRITACLWILHSDDFTVEQKRRVEYLYVYQLTDHATDDQRHAVEISMNFEPDQKKNWSDFVRAQIIYDEWQARLALEPRGPNTQRQLSMRRELAGEFGYGSDITVVTRFLKMMSWATDFMEYFINIKKEDEFEVKHKADKYFQYFDELSKGENAGGVAHTLNNVDGYKYLVFDLLFQGKFASFMLIRKLKNYDAAVRKGLTDAREEPVVDLAQDIVEDTLAGGQSRRAEARQVGADIRISTFVKWLEDVPPSAYRDEITQPTLLGLLGALELVKPLVEANLNQQKMGL